MVEAKIEDESMAHIRPGEPDTTPKYLLQACRKHGDGRVCLRKKQLGIWKTYTWKDYYEHVKAFCLGMVSLGLERGDKVAIIGDNTPEWYFADLGVQSTGATAVGIYTDSTAADVRYIIDHADARFVVAKDQEQIDKMLDIKNELPMVQKVIYWDENGLWDYADPILCSFEEVEEMGRKYEEEHPGVFEELVEQGKGEDVCLLMYTSGTTGAPKGALISHNSLIYASRLCEASSRFEETDESFSFLPPAWMADHYYNIAPMLMIGFTVNFAEEPDTVPENIREIGPQVLLFSSTQWELMTASIQSRIDASGWLSRVMFNWALRTGYRVVDARFSNRKVSRFRKSVWRVADGLVFAPLRDKHGLGRIRVPVTGAGLLAPDIMRLFYAIGVPLRNGYGASEAGPVSTPFGDGIRLESVGQIPPGISVKILDTGEIVVRSPALFSGYYKMPEETAKAMEDGWYHTGDAGHLDEEGYLYFWDRVKDLSELEGGVKFAPQFIESRLKFSPYIKHVMTIGDPETPYVTAIVNMNFDSVAKWAERHRIVYTTYADLAGKTQVYDLIQQDIDRVNTALPEAAKIKKFVLLHKEFDPDEAELTRSRKLRRRFMRERYKELLDAMYSDKTEVPVEAQVKYRDGRVATITHNIEIRTVGET